MATILIVDDSRVILSVVQTYLVGMDAQIRVATSAEQALQLFEADPADVVISDIQMPGMNGLELAKALKQKSPGVKVVLISAAKRHEGSDAARRGFVDAFLAKPIDGDVLRHRVKRLLDASSAEESGPASVAVAAHHPARPIRVLVADDTEVGRRIIERMLRADPDFELVAIAKDGQEAVDLTLSNRPALVLMDANMPKLDGLHATRRIMQDGPTRVVIVTENYDPKSATAGFEATRAGALDLLQRPSFGDPSGPAATSFRERLKDLADVPVIGRRNVVQSPETPPRHPISERSRADAVAMIASTGGPGVLASLLAKLGDAADCVPVLVVQHLLEGFDVALVTWLSEVTARPVRLARDGDPVVPGIVFAPDGRHLTVRPNRTLTVSEEPRTARHRPSGDLLLESTARAFGAGTVGVILTGMGDDGLSGARLVRARGGIVIAQDPDTCVVPGMPTAAIDAGVADLILTPNEIADELGARMTEPV